jgi:hypothetical protein
MPPCTPPWRCGRRTRCGKELPSRSATFPGLGLLAAALMLVAGCGGGGDGSTTVVLLTFPADDGYITSDGIVDDESLVRAGDNAVNESRRGFARFPLASVPPGVTIVSAVLELRQTAVLGDPYGSFGDVVVHHVNFGAGIDATDFDSPILSAVPGFLSTDATLGTKSIDVTAQVIADLVAGRAHSDFRIRFSGAMVTADNLQDSALFSEATSTPGSVNAPRVTVTYED